MKLKACSLCKITCLVPRGCLGCRPGSSSEVLQLVRMRTQAVLKSDCSTFANIFPREHDSPKGPASGLLPELPARGGCYLGVSGDDRGCL